MANLSIVVCGAPLSARAQEFCDLARERGWDASLVVTEAARAWVSAPPSAFRSPDAPKPPRPDAVIVAPMTFNTGTKWALGIADTYPLSLLAESLGAGKPIVAVPFVNDSLWGHPAWSRTIATLGEAGVALVNPTNGTSDLAPLPSGAGDDVTDSVRPEWLLDLLPTPG
jgi:hypothetical protein